MMKLVKMQHEVSGQTADVHPAEVENYKLGGFRAVQEEKEAEEVKPRRGRKPKGLTDG